MAKLQKDGAEGMRKRFFLMALLPVLILFGTYQAAFSVAAFVVCCFIMLVEQNHFFLCFLFYIMPMAGIFKLGPGSSSLFTYLELLYIVWHLMRKRLWITKGELMALFFAAYIVVTGNVHTSLNVVRAVKLVSNLMLLGYLTELDPEKDHRQLFLFYVAGVIVSSLMRFADSTAFPIAQYAAETLERYEDTYVVRFSGLYGDPNYYSVNVIIAMCLTLVLYKRKELSLVQTVGLNIPLVIFVGLTGSKSGFLMLVLPLALIMYICVKNKNYVALASCILVLAGAAFLVFSGRLASFEYILYRLGRNTSNADAFTTGRIGLWRNYMQYLAENPVWSLVGCGGMTVLFGDHGPHNTYIDLIFQFGVVGTGLYLTTMYFLIKKHSRVLSRNKVNFSIWAVVIIMYMFLSELQSYDMAFHIALASTVWNLRN